MALPLYDLLEKRRQSSDSSRPSLEDPSRFSFEEDDRLNEMDPLDGSTSHKFDYEEDRPALSKRQRLGDFISRRRPLGVLARKEARDKKVEKLKRTFLVPGRLCLLLALIVASIGLAAVGGGGYWVYKKRPDNGQSPPWYPTPKGGTVKTWEESYRKAALMVSEMSLLEKVNITTGTGWMMGPCVGNTAPATGVGFPALCLQDGPLGIRFADHITASPAGITVGATWNKDLMYKRGRMLGLENRLKGVNVMLGPAVGPLGRMPAGGRTWEGFGSDPVLQGWAASQTVKGIQEEGVIATIKHFIGNEQEHFRQSFEWGLPNAMSSNLDDRTLHELYAWPFADSVRAGVASVMCSYNQVNNSYACQNSKLLNGILKDELGFQGFVQSDWLAQRSGVASAAAGLDMSMPGDGLRWADGSSVWGPHLTMAIINGSLPMARLDDMVTRIVAAWYQLGQDDKTKWPAPMPEGDGGPNFSSWTNEKTGLIHPGSDDETTAVVNHFVDVQRMGGYSHSSLVRRIAAEGTILLKNEGDILPLSRDGLPQSTHVTKISGRKYKVAIFGEDATLAKNGPNACSDRGCNEGTLASGWGSGAVEFPHLVSPLMALQHAFHSVSVDVAAFPTNDLPSASKNGGIEDQDLCIVFANADAGEGFVAWDGVKGDRNDLNLQKGGDALIQDVAANCGRNLAKSAAEKIHGNTIVVIHSVGPVILESFIEDSNVRAVVYANLPGQESGYALEDVLFGDMNPSGHLPYSIGKSLKDYGPGGQVLYSANGVVPQQDFKEGLLIDYRWFDAQNITPRYPFGYGLSYTTFDLEKMVISVPEGMTRPEPLPAPRPQDEVSPPTYASKLPAIHDLFFPSGWRKLKKYVYPYLESDDVVVMGEYPYPNMTPQTPSAAGGGEGGNPSLWEILVSVDVTVVNTGTRDGQAVVQLYVVFPEDVYEYIEESTDRRAVTKDAMEEVDLDGLQIRQMHDTGFEDPKYHEGSVVKVGSLSSDPSTGDQVQARPQKSTGDDDEIIDSVMEEMFGSSKSDEVVDDQRVEEESTMDDFVDDNADSNDKTDEAATASKEEAPAQEDTASAPEKVETAADADVPTTEEADLVEAYPDDTPALQPSAAVPNPQSSNPPIKQTTPLQKPHNTATHSTARERIHFPPRVLRAFEKVNTYTSRNGDATAQDKKVVTFQLTRRDLSYWSVRKQNWVLPEGSFKVEVGFDSRDLRLSGVVF